FEMATFPPVRAQSGGEPAASATLLAAPRADAAQALILSVHGDCEYSADGVTFSPLKEIKEGATLRGSDDEEGAVKRLWSRSLSESAVLRTGKDAQADIFLTRTGTTVRVHADSELKLERLIRIAKDQVPPGAVVLDLTRGRITVAVRALVPGSTIEVKSAAGRAVIGGSGTKGRYSIAADGTEIADRDSDVPLKLVTDAGVRVIPPAEKSLARKSRPLPENPSETEIALLAADDFETVSKPRDF
ncbi:MAG TPA: hypothetical protein VMB21_07375, partial [Candidatus Limnocylindria bacterium]|nr:hypothetical protein [Candidatus Limnocylindria bacterium]